MGADPRVRADVEWREVEGRVVVMDVATGSCVALNRTGAALWRALVAGASEDGLAGVLADGFGIDLARARGDVGSFLEALRARGLLAD
jgi:hypothetical protein